MRTLATGLAVSAVGTLALAIASVASAAPSPGSRTTLHFFSKHTSASYFNPDGTNIPNGTTLVPGDFYTFTDTDYVGNHSHHAKKASGTDFITCTLTSETTGICDGALSLRDSMLVITRIPVDLTKNATVPIVAGTGTLSNIENGSVVINGVGNSRNSDLVVRYDEPPLPPV